jgi:hypothetical protein
MGNKAGMNYGYYYYNNDDDSRMGQLEKKLCIVAIRAAAQDLAGDLGQCTDFQIIFCASAVKRLKRLTGAYTSLEDVSDDDLKSLYQWMITEEHRSIYGD